MKFGRGKNPAEEKRDILRGSSSAVWWAAIIPMGERGSGFHDDDIKDRVRHLWSGGGTEWYHRVGEVVVVLQELQAEMERMRQGKTWPLVVPPQFELSL